MCDTSTVPKNVISQNDFLQFFNLENKDIESFAISHQKDDLHIAVTLARKPHRCPVCLNMTDQVKDYSTKTITHSVLTSHRCVIDYRARRYRCKKCNKTFYELNPFSVAGSRISLATVYNILRDLKHPAATFKDVAQRYHISQTTAAHIFDSFVCMSRRQLPQYLCIDEVYAFKSEKSRYICVLLDFQSQNIVDVLPSRRKQVLMDYFFNIPLSERKKVKVVSFDMWESYRVVSKIMFPDALCAVDHYHVKQEFHRKLDKVRINSMNRYYSRKNYLNKKENLTEAEKNELSEVSRHYYVLKKFHWMLFSNNNKCIYDPNVEKKYNKVLQGYFNYYDIFDYMIRDDRELDLAYDLKYQLDVFYRDSSYDSAKKNIDELITLFKSSPIKEMKDFANTLTKWKREIVNSFIRADGKRISNGIIENRNKSIKLLKHSSNVYLNWHRFKNRVMYCLNDDATYHMYPIKNTDIK